MRTMPWSSPTVTEPDDGLVAAVVETLQQWFADLTTPQRSAGVAVLVLVLLILRALVRRKRRGGSRRGRRAPRPGEVWYALVPFDDGTGAKDRPVLVLRRSGRHVVVARFTSQDKSGRRDHVRAPAGLPGMLVAGWLDLTPRTLRPRAFRRCVGDAGEALVAWHDSVREEAGIPA
ncbi:MULTISPECIES: hypothetical protein [Cellulomonas]|uniref:hypothetical protein n=1 Tax=Cellulomonas TaxID=1707 RepID=UPI00069D073E|nr:MULTISPECIES: hypothetical protein [Cellulomonas]MCR6705920.1 type II toxin-antitoxin system PemK/MazF family toxin [Cellulomonas sp.]GGL13671.1 hypothetical protein GCM10009774_00430 [Cellulomonas gelida]